MQSCPPPRWFISPQAFFAAVDNVVDIFFVNACYADQVQQGQNSGCFGNHVLEHCVSREVFVNVMSSLYETNSFASKYQWLSMFFVYKVLNFGSVNTFMDSCNDGIVDYWVAANFSLVAATKLFSRLTSSKTSTHCISM